MGTASKITLILVALFLASLVILPPVNSQSQSSQITINSDGSITGTDKIQQDGNTYTLTANLTSPITVNKNNTVLDGAGFTLQGSDILLENNSGVSLIGQSNIIIENLSIFGFNNAIFLNNSINCVIKGNKIFGNNNHGISMNNSREIWANQNNIETTSKFAVYAYNSNYTLFTENRIKDNFGSGLYIISNNYAKDYSLYPLISVISNNAFDNNSGNDICLDGSNNTITGNIISDSGILVDGDYNLAAKNNITNCLEAITYFGENNTFTQNNFINNNVVVFTNGVILSNIFFLNNFIDNHGGVTIDQLYDLQGPSSPSWNNGTFGNYYSDYQSKYPLAKEIDNTGTYDTNYTITNIMTFTNAIIHYPFYDNHPLVSPINITQPPAATPTWQIPTETPTINFINIVVVTVFVILAIAVLSLLLYRRHRKTAK